jgi:tight adherence protein C
MEPLLLLGVSALALGLAIAGASLVYATARQTGVARALVDIDRVYSPAAAARQRATLADRLTRPVLRLLTALGRALTPPTAAAWLRRWLDYAGNPAAWPPERIHETQGLGLVTIGFLGGVVGLGLAYGGDRGLVAPTLAGALAGALAGLWLPFLVVSHVGQKRQQQIQATLPDALDMLTLCVEAGLPFDAALAQVAHGTRGPLAGEIARVLHETQMGKRRSEAMRDLADRTNVLELRVLATAIVQATDLGIPIAQVLREQSREMRVRRRQRAEEAARKVPVKVLFPLILCLFPALFIVILGPGVLRIMDTLLR